MYSWTCEGVSSDLAGCILGLGWVYSVGFLGYMETKPEVFIPNGSTMDRQGVFSHRPDSTSNQVFPGLTWPQLVLTWPKLAVTRFWTMGKDTLSLDR